MEVWWWNITLLSSLLLSLISVAYTQTAHKRFEYKYSFKGPYLAQKDNQVPFWTYSGNAIASEESVRITPSLRSQKGQIWTKNPTNFEWWEVDFVFRVTGRGRIGADGLAFWFTSSPGVEGPVFGSSDKWNGLGVFFDSFDNDNKRNNPYIMAMVNDGTIVYDHEHDGISQQLGGCLRDFRNKPFPVRARVEYYKNVLTVKTQLLEYDYSKLEEDTNTWSTDAPGTTRPPDIFTTTPPPYYGTTTPAMLDEYSTTTQSPNEYTTTTSPYSEYESTTTMPTTLSPYNEAGTTQASPTTSYGLYTVDTADGNSVLVEPVHRDYEGEMTEGWGWFGTTEQPTTAPTTLKPKKERRKKQRRRGRRGKKRTKSVPVV